MGLIKAILCIPILVLAVVICLCDPVVAIVAILLGIVFSKNRK